MFLELAERSKFVMETVLYVMFSGWLNQLSNHYCYYNYHYYYYYYYYYY